MYEQKGAFSDVSFFQPIHQGLQEQKNAEAARVLKATDLGRESELLTKEHQKVLQQIAELSDFCKECKPPKKRRKRKTDTFNKMYKVCALLYTNSFRPDLTYPL